MRASPRRRGRKPKFMEFGSEDENIQENDENVSSFAGDQFVNEWGEVINETKETRLKTFLLPERDSRVRFCLILDLARTMGGSDSFRFLQRYPDLPRFFVTQEEREELIEGGFVHPIMKYRNVPCIQFSDAYSVFKENLLKNKGEISDEEEDFETGNARQTSNNKKIYWEGLKPEQPVEKEGGDWIYRCALSAAFYNKTLDKERKNRLWGESVIRTAAADKPREKRSRVNYREDYSDFEFEEEDDDDDEEDEEEEEVKEKKGKEISKDEEEKDENVQVVKNNGFYDVHTNVNQVPASTQLFNYKITLDKQKQTLADWLGEKYQPPANPSLYPVALVRGQYQASISIFPHRFGYENAQYQPIQLLSGEKTLQTLTQPQQQQARPSYESYSQRPQMPMQPMPMMPQLYGTPMMPPHGHRFSMSGHSFGSSTPRTKSPIFSDPACHICHTALPMMPIKKKKNQTESEGRDLWLLSSLELLAVHAIECYKCLQYYHFSCLDQCTPTMAAKMKTYRWECQDCKSCMVCRITEEAARKNPNKRALLESKGELLICDDCDRGFHVRCLNPPMEMVPTGTWRCEFCAKCQSCQKKQSDHPDMLLTHRVAPTTQPSPSLQGQPIDQYLTTLCTDCVEEFDAGHFCPVCLRIGTHQSEELNAQKRKRKKKNEEEMVQCKQCERYLHHPYCDPVLFTGRDGEKYLNPDSKVAQDYNCVLCRLENEKKGALVKEENKTEQKEKEETKKEEKGPERVEILPRLPTQLSSSDEEELERKKDRKEKIFKRKRGRPRKEPSLEELEDAEETKLLAPIKEKHCVVYLGKWVVSPSLRYQDRW